MSTPQNQWKRISATNIVTAAGVTTGRTDVSGVATAPPTALANESAIFPTEFDDFKIRAYLSLAGGTLTARVLGWTFNDEDNLWMAETLCEASGVAHASTSVTIAGTALYPITAWTIIQASGNCRVGNSTSDKAAASLLIDHQGNQFAEFAGTTAAIRTFNALRKAC